MYKVSMCIHVEFMLTQSVTVNVPYLSLFSASLHLSLALSVADFFTDFPSWWSLLYSWIGLSLEWLSAMQVAVTDPGMVLYCLSSTEVLNLGLTSVSSEVWLSVSGLL